MTTRDRLAGAHQNAPSRRSIASGEVGWPQQARARARRYCKSVIYTRRRRIARMCAQNNSGFGGNPALSSDVTGSRMESLPSLLRVE